MSIYNCTYCDKPLGDDYREVQKIIDRDDVNLCCMECAGQPHPVQWILGDHVRYLQRPTEEEDISFDEWIKANPASPQQLTLFDLQSAF